MNAIAIYFFSLMDAAMHMPIDIIILAIGMAAGALIGLIAHNIYEGL